MSRRAPTEEQKAKAEERRSAFRQLAKRLADMPQEQYAALAAQRVGQVVTVEGHPLSVHNAILCAMQLDAVTLVGGYDQWRRYGRHVRKDEQGLMIWVPSSKTKKAEAGNGEGAAAEATGPRPGEMSSERPNFFMGYVFDVSQTDEVSA